MFWNAIYTKPRSERKVTSQLEEMGIKVYCPMVTQIRQWSDRKKKILVPAISSYVFVKLPEAERHLVFQVPGTMRYVFWQGKPAKIWTYEIEAMQKALSGKIEGITLSQYTPGDKMIIPNGLFRDQEVILQKRDDKHLFLTLAQTGLQIIIKLS